MIGDRGGTDQEVALYGRPTASELLEAAREFLQDEVFPATEGRTQFHTRVAVRVLDTVIRQMELGPSHLQAHGERLAALEYGSDWDLVHAIRHGQYDSRIGELARVLADDVRAKLEVADPRYLG